VATAAEDRLKQSFPANRSSIRAMASPTACSSQKNDRRRLALSDGIGNSLPVPGPSSARAYPASR